MPEGLSEYTEEQTRAFSILRVSMLWATAVLGGSVWLYVAQITTPGGLLILMILGAIFAVTNLRIITVSLISRHEIKKSPDAAIAFLADLE